MTLKVKTKVTKKKLKFFLFQKLWYCGISRVKVTKFLGVIIDENLNWKEHIKLVSSKISKNIAIIYKAKQFFENSFVLRTLYCSLILPYLMYCMEIWGNTYKYNLKGIVLLQKRAIRIISGANRLAHTNKLFYDLKLLKLNDMVEYQSNFDNYIHYICIELLIIIFLKIFKICLY